MPKGLKKLTLKAIDNSIRSKGLQPKFNGMAPKGPKRTPAPAPARAAPQGAQLDSRSQNPTGFVTPAQAAAIGLASAAVTGAGTYAAANSGGLRRIGKRPPPMGPFAPSIAPSGGQAAGGGSRGPGTSGPTYAPVAVGIQKHGTNPKMWAKANKGNVQVTVEHTEYLRDLSGTAAFAPTPLAINPGNTETFAWLSDLAGLFETYRFEKLEFTYNPSVGTDTDGKLLMTFDPDVMDDVPDTKQVMLEARVQLDATPWQPSILRIPRDLLGEERYVRSGAVPVYADANLYYVGTLLYATPGVPVATCGVLFVTYRVVFSTPNGPTPRAGSLWASTASGAPTPAAPLGITAPIAAQNPGPLRPNWLSGTTFSLPSIGDYRLVLYFGGTNFAGMATLTASGDNTATSIISSYALTQSFAEYAIKVLDPTDVFTVVAPTSATTITGTRIHVFPFDEDWL